MPLYYKIDGAMANIIIKRYMKNTAYKIEKISDSIKNMLIEKNNAYGDSALKPLNVFSSLSAIEGLCARIDDKLSRISNRGFSDETEDTVFDLCGYFILLIIALENEKDKRDALGDTTSWSS